MKRKFDASPKDRSARDGETGPAGALSLAEGVMDFVVADPARLLRFMEASGLDPAALRAAAGSPDLLTGILDHVVSDEETLLACAGALGVPPERITAAWRRLGPPDPDSFGA
ncbi:DUF3572 family protein [Methylobacterium oryzihabitans]|uniref:DUF3572 family protein n=2 Tax=Methylobacterium oryzihabitans TaxID=2499852 RepID=A0A3S2V7N6_9HYPH|nr:DUF3572 domain-containing protein [Methylobacterium oryzihabitans]RVU16329.1 DUF3572 family protein [Methylobacterium oryzihabitans]